MQHQRKAEGLGKRLAHYLRRNPIVRPSEVERIGIPREYLLRLHREGKLDRTSRGIYTSKAADVTENHSLAEVAKRVPRAVVCLVSALAFHGITTQVPHEVWIAIDRRARRPAGVSPHVRVFRVSSPAFDAGVEVKNIEGVPVRVYSAAKAVADCFKFRNKIGLDVAIEALKEAVRERKATRSAILEFAKLCRVANVIRPYLESL